MITTNKYQTISQHHKSTDWSFLPTLLSALLGVGIGIILGSYWGWI
ncbi:MAG: hypothetical protein AAGF83_07330 [Cyanobacteria bacterium P01_G01_bin.67]